MDKKRSKAMMPLKPRSAFLVLSDIEKYTKGVQTGRVVVETNKCFMLVYSDDVALLAKTEEDMRGTLRRFK